MDAYTYLVQRQIQWARRHGIALEKRSWDEEEGEPECCPQPDQNLLVPLSAESRADHEREIGRLVDPSLRWLACPYASEFNLFEYWRQHNLLSVIATACGLPQANIGEMSYNVFLPMSANAAPRRSSTAPGSVS